MLRIYKYGYQLLLLTPDRFFHKMNYMHSVQDTLVDDLLTVVFQGVLSETGLSATDIKDICVGKSYTGLLINEIGAVPSVLCKKEKEDCLTLVS